MENTRELKVEQQMANKEDFIPAKEGTYLREALFEACSMVCKMQGKGSPYQLAGKLTRQSAARIAGPEAASREELIATVLEAYRAEEAKDTAKEEPDEGERG